MDIASLIQGMAILAWLAVAGLIVVLVVRAGRGRSSKGGIPVLIGMGILAILLSIVGAGLVFLQPEERGIIISPYVSQGYRPNVLGAGLHWIIPGESVRRYKISNQTYTMSIAPEENAIYKDDSIAARTADGQEIYVDASVIFAVNPARVIDVHILWQDRYVNELVRPLVRGIIRDAISQYGVEQVVSSKRFEMTQQVRDTLTAKFDENGINLVDFVLRNITFSEEYAYSVEQKQIAEQQALQAKFVVEQKKQEAEQARQVAQGQADAAVITAEGAAKARVIEAQAAAQARIIEAEAEAEALRKIAEALATNPNLLQYQYITKLGPNVKVIIMPSGAQFILPPELVTP